jgi:hypothetical protein
MPLTAKGQEILANMEKRYGEKKGKEVFYASRNKGTISGVDNAGDPDENPGSLESVLNACDAYDKKHECG